MWYQRIVYETVNLSWFLLFIDDILSRGVYIDMGAPRHAGDYTRRIGDKIKQGLKTAGTLKGMHSKGSTIYKGVQFAAPIVAGMML